MGWLSSLFSPQTTSLRKGQALSSTHEAFSLPPSSPMLGQSHHDIPNSPDPESAMASAYTYPPQGPNSYRYVPTAAGSNSRRASALLPTHHDGLHSPALPSAPYPPLMHTWNRLRAWLIREYPELGDTLNYGILPQDLAQIEMQFGFALPTVVRDSYLCVDGQEAESAAGCAHGLFFGLTLLPLEDVYEEWRFWREVDEDPMTGANPQLREAMQSIPPGWIRKEYSQRGWIPLVADKAGNYIGIDLNPGEAGAVGQVVVFGRDFDTKVVLWNGNGAGGWARWLAAFVDELESGDGFEIGATQDDEGSEDDLGYESYFYDGSGRGQGDGGGDTGSGGGLKLTGEYRGWNVMEAWADRSLRKWYDAGVVSDLSLLPADSKAKAVDKPGLHQDSAAHVPIPVTTRERNSMVAVSRAPAPRPVDLPTADDITVAPSPPPRHTNLSHDLEAGMREVALDPAMSPPSRAMSLNSPLPLLATHRQRQEQELRGERRNVREEEEKPPMVPPKVQVLQATPRQETTPIPDLLTPIDEAKDTSSKSTPVSEMKRQDSEKPLIDAATPRASVDDAEVVAISDSPLTAEPKDEKEESDTPPETTVRLVGGGGPPGDIRSSTENASAPLHQETTVPPSAAASAAVPDTPTSPATPTTAPSVITSPTKSISSPSKQRGSKGAFSGLAGGLKKLGHHANGSSSSITSITSLSGKRSSKKDEKKEEKEKEKKEKKMKNDSKKETAAA